MLFLLLYQIWVHKDVSGTGTRDEPLRTYVWEAKFMTELKIPCFVSMRMSTDSRQPG